MGMDDGVSEAERYHPCCIHCDHDPGAPHPDPCASCDAGY
jgi:hypothetical protein